jgi:hypothetical protein
VRWYPWRQLLEPLTFLDLTSVWEQAWLARWTATERLGTGAVVELGTWIGASTVALARGLGEGEQLVSYDRFRFTEIGARTAGTPFADRWAEGATFRPTFDARLGRARERVLVHDGDLLEERWEGGAIELLFVDVAKTWVLWDHILEGWVSHVHVGGVVVQQDWAHANTPWLHLWHHRWRDHFEALDPVPFSTMAAFRLVAPLPPEALRPVRLDDHDPDEVRAAFRWARPLVPEEMAANVAGAEVLLHTFHGTIDDAVEVALRVVGEVPVADELAETALPLLARRIATERPG